MKTQLIAVRLTSAQVKMLKKIMKKRGMLTQSQTVAAMIELEYEAL